jgi:CRP-like cAMP-binding protein
LFLAGDRARRVFGIARGVIKLGSRNADGGETILGLAVQGDLVGEIAAIDELPQPLDAVAATPCEVLSFDADELLEAVPRNPAASHELNASLAARLRWTSDCAAERAAAPAGARLAGRLLDLADLIGRVDGDAVTLDLPMGQGDLGRLAGICRESVCKNLRRMKADGILDYHGRKLRILRPDVLENIRCAGRA